MTKYQEFQEWLNQCPVKVIDYQDFSDQFQVTFDVPLEDDTNEVAQCIVDTNGDYAECVDRMVSTMGSGVELENVTDEWYDKEGNLIP
tara:strand:+ start:201 stop:464 length:264 start_codon:yes stop_codon:yes gene_type:complete